MTTLTRGIQAIVPGTRSLTVEDRLDAVLQRLDSGEQLVPKRLKYGNNLCIMGLFADESGIVQWHGDQYRRKRHTYVNLLDMDVVTLFNLRDPIGSFDLESAPDELKDLIREHLGAEAAQLNRLSLTVVNDSMLALEKREQANPVLAAIIRSGVVFNK